MKPMLLTAFSMLLLALMSCRPTRTADRWVTSTPSWQSAKYKPKEHATRIINAIVIDSAEGRALPFATVELYLKTNLTKPFNSTITSSRGRFRFDLMDGNYVISISHDRYKEREIVVSVNGWDIDLDEIKLCPIFN